jgi:hypothetical protein
MAPSSLWAQPIAPQGHRRAGTASVGMRRPPGALSMALRYIGPR